MKHDCHPDSPYTPHRAVQASIPATVIQHARLLAAKIKKHELTCFPAVPGVREQTEVMERIHDLVIKHNLCGSEEESAHSIAEEWKHLVQLIRAAGGDELVSR